MPYKKILMDLLQDLPGAHAAVLLDAQGELVVEAGDGDARHRLIGAYQGIALSRLEKLANDYPTGSVRALVSRHTQGQVVVTPLKDGYFLVLSLTPHANIALGVHLLAKTAVLVNQEL
jgi:predicted regulator of Ras-like GTPase activity (Roadblock/LC7/MglB family)